MRLAFPLLAAASLLALAPAASADSPDDATRSAARKLAQEGLDLYDAGKHQDALDRFLRVEALMHAPTMLLMAARALDKLGRLVEASEKYAAASRAELGADASDAFRDAVKDAQKEREALLLRIPSIVMMVDVPPGVEVTLKLDGAPISTASLGQKKLIDPGGHTIEASGGGASAASRVDVKEGESRTVHLDLRTGAPQTSPLRTIGWVGIGLGAAGVVLGAVSGGLALQKNSELAVRCKTGCPDDKATADELAYFETVKTLTTAGLVGGGIALAGGAALVLFAPKPAPAPAPAARLQWSPWVGMAAIGLKGSF